MLGAVITDDPNRSEQGKCVHFKSPFILKKIFDYMSALCFSVRYGILLKYGDFYVPGVGFY